MIALSLIQDEIYNGILMIGWKSGDAGARTWIVGRRSRGITSSAKFLDLPGLGFTSFSFRNVAIETRYLSIRILPALPQP
ncbi:MAG: hypothetical protein ABS69_09530 [Nitrosomonadales bacterium SCN 54-20]|nr:MAG: hypothetical protein ABS69_09530 [Nitrosomonadales bacterium SCN 54-20]